MAVSAISTVEKANKFIVAINDEAAVRLHTWGKGWPMPQRVSPSHSKPARATAAGLLIGVYL